MPLFRLLPNFDVNATLAEFKRGRNMTAKVLQKLSGDYAGETSVKYVVVFNFVSLFHVIAEDKKTAEYPGTVHDSESCCYNGLSQDFLNSPS